MRCIDCQRPEKFWARLCLSEDGVHTFRKKNGETSRAGIPRDYGWSDERRENLDWHIRGCITANQFTQSKMFKRMGKYGKV